METEEGITSVQTIDLGINSQQNIPTIKGNLSFKVGTLNKDSSKSFPNKPPARI